MVGVKDKLLNVIAPEVNVTSALGFITTVEYPGVKAPPRVNNVPDVPVRVIVEKEFAPSSVPFIAVFKNPVLKLKLEFV